MAGVLNAVFAPGFFASQPVRMAILTGAIVAFASGAIGVITVLRGQSFAGHALTALGTLGGAVAFLLNVSAFWGFLGGDVVVAGVIELAGTQRRRGRDVATGLVYSTALGVSALFLYFDTIVNTTTGVTTTILFGSLFSVSSRTVPVMIVLSIVCLAVVTLLYRPLLLSSVSSELAATRGIPVRALGFVFLLVMALSAALTSVTVGTILGTALLIGPAATALRLTRRPGMAMVLSGALGTASTWIGIVLAYDSYRWPPVGKGWPVSFFVVAMIFACYLLAGLGSRSRAGRVRQRRDGSPIAAQPPAMVRSS